MTGTEPTRFKNGDPITHDELNQAFFRITGRHPPRGRAAHSLAALLSRAEPVRFEFEINRARGFAWDNGEGPLYRRSGDA